MQYSLAVYLRIGKVYLVSEIIGVQLMAFNAKTYRRNQYRAKALKELAMARDIKARAAHGNAYDWELPRIATLAKLARLNWRLYLLNR